MACGQRQVVERSTARVVSKMPIAWALRINSACYTPVQSVADKSTTILVNDSTHPSEGMTDYLLAMNPKEMFIHNQMGRAFKAIFVFQKYWTIWSQERVI